MKGMDMAAMNNAYLLVYQRTSSLSAGPAAVPRMSPLNMSTALAVQQDNANFLQHVLLLDSHLSQFLSLYIPQAMQPLTRISSAHGERLLRVALIYLSSAAVHVRSNSLHYAIDLFNAVTLSIRQFPAVRLSLSLSCCFLS